MLIAKKAFVLSAAVTLILTAALKIFGVTQQAPYMVQPDPLFQIISNRTMILLAAAMEGMVGGFMLQQRPDRLKLSLLVWLSLLFLSYRAGLELIGFSGFCPCLGGPMNWLGMKPAFADSVAKWIIGYFLVFGLGFLVAEWRQNRGIEQATKEATA